jgi:starch-binding outer membrane protein, SusD/RagB family
MKRIILTGLLAMTLLSCQDLDEKPQGYVSGDDLNTPANLEKLVIGAYSLLGSDHWPFVAALWPQGSVRSDDAYKGGDGPNDQAEMHAYQVFSLNRIDNGHIDVTWFRFYVRISRANDVLRRLNEVDEAEFPLKKVRQAEMRFLRAHYYFNLKILFKYMPYIDETVKKEDYPTISNDVYTNDALWSKIADDFRFAAENLPETQPEVGRANRYAAKAYLAKTLLFQAYQQDEQNQVTGIDNTKLEDVVDLCAEVEGHYDLHDDFAKNFLTEFENGIESIFAIQYSKQDASPFGRIDWSHKLNYPMNTEFGCCGFHAPSQNLVNAYQTDDETGLPLFDTFNDDDIRAGSTDFQTHTFDPRLDHTVAIPGHPYKYSSFVFQNSWVRSPQIYGYFMSMKETVAPDDPSFQKAPPFMSSSKNWDILRYDEVLLWRAEALIELGRHNEALPLINALRKRAGQSTSRLKWEDNTFVSNYLVDEYQPGVNCTWTQDFARQALRWESRLELAMEEDRFFNLVRWGIAEETLNHYFESEKAKVSYMKDARFTAGRDEYLPVPLAQMNLSKNLYKQNAGW